LRVIQELIERRSMAKKSQDEEEAIIGLVFGLLIAIVAIFMFVMRI
jgi:hypothetical protein